MKGDHIICHPAGTHLGVKGALLIITRGQEAYLAHNGHPAETELN